MDNKNLPFIDLEPISGLEKVTTFDPGSLLFAGDDGVLKRIDAERFYQLLDKIAKPISPTDPMPTVVGWYKPQISSELDKPIDPNSTADWGEKYPNTGNLRAKSGYDTLFYFEGGPVWKKAESKIPVNTKKVFDPSNNVDPATMKATADYLGSTPLELSLGSNLVGSQTQDLSSYTTETLISNTSCIATNNIILKSIVTNFTTGGKFKVAITSATNTIVFRSDEFTAGTGWVTTALPNIKVEKGQTVWLVCMPSNTLVIKFGPGNTSGTNFIQRSNTGVIINGPDKVCYSLYFNAISDYPHGVLGDYITRSEADGYKNIDPSETFGSTNVTTPFGHQPMTAYYIMKIPFNQIKTIQKLVFNTGINGIMQFVVGSLDQYNKFIEERSYKINVINGLNTINVDIELKVGQYLGIKTPGPMPSLDLNMSHPYTWGVDTGYTDPLKPIPNWSLSLTMDVRTRVYNDNSLAHISDINLLQKQIDNIKVSNVWKSPDGTSWKVSVSNTGQFIAQAVGKYTKILHFGNSILKHPITSFWWGNWGMAAKTKEDDYAHRFLAKMKVTNPTAQSWEKFLVDWESNPVGYDKAQLDSLLAAQAYDLIIIRLGENATGTPAATYKTEFRKLVEYIQNKVPTARIIIGGMFWIHAGLEAAMIEIANEKGFTFVSMGGLDKPENRSFIGDVVKGDDGQDHAVDNQGVANHPNNNGMEGIAVRLLNGVNS